MFAQSGTGVPSTLQTSRKVDYNGEEFYSPRPLSLLFNGEEFEMYARQLEEKQTTLKTELLRTGKKNRNEINRKATSIVFICQRCSVAVFNRAQ